MSTREQPLLASDAMVESRRRPRAVKIAGVILGCVGLLCVVASSSGPSGTRRSPVAPAPVRNERRGGLSAQASAISLDASLTWKRPKKGGRRESGCPYTKKGCETMVLAKGNRTEATRDLDTFEDLVVTDIIKVLSYDMKPGVQPSITFMANERLLDALVADVAERILTLGAGCACLHQLGDDAITVRIINTVWPRSMQFVDVARGIFADITASSVRCQDAASVSIRSLTGPGLEVSCGDVADVEIGSVAAHREANFSASDSCNLAVIAGGADSSEVTVRDTANANLGTFAVRSTRVRTSGVCSVQGQVARRGEYEATDSSFLESSVKDGGRAACHDMAYIGLHTSSGDIDTHQEDMCTIDIADA